MNKVKCRHCQTILADEIHEMQTCKCGKLGFDTAKSQFYTRILGNREDYEIIE